MSDRIKARLDSLEKRYTKPTYAFEDMPKPPVPLANMSKEWQDQYHKDPNMISMIWQRVVREYHESHIQAWLDSERRTPTPPWGMIIPPKEIYDELSQIAEARLTLYTALKRTS